MLTYLKDKNNKSKTKYKIYKTPTSILESVDSIVNIGATTVSVTVSVTGVDLIVVPMFAGIACALSLGNKVIHKILQNIYNKYKKQIEEDQQTNKSFDKLYRKSFQDNLIDESEYESCM